MNCKELLLKLDTSEMLVSILEQQLAEKDAAHDLIVAAGVGVMESLRQQLANMTTKAEHWEATCHSQWECNQIAQAESQAREAKLRDGLINAVALVGDAVARESWVTVIRASDGGDSTALDEAIKQTKREVLEDVVCDIAGCDSIIEAQVYIHGLIEEL